MHISIISWREVDLKHFNSAITHRMADIPDGMPVLRQERGKLVPIKCRLGDEARLKRYSGEIVGDSPPLRKVLDSVETVASTRSSVLITGETGTGKELVARAIHQKSLRKNRSFVKVNCAALPDALIESELFGHERGAFTGAVFKRTGRFELAHNGTIFLDEIGEMPFSTQGKLLGVLQDGAFERVGGIKTVHIDVRIIAASNRDLQKMVAEGLFREDLFYRLNVYPIFVPPLRERKEDIPVLAFHFAEKYASIGGNGRKTIPDKTLQVLSEYDWPGNVRELENIIERGVIAARGERLNPGDWLPEKAAELENWDFPTLEEVEKEHILRALKLTDGRVSGEKGAARLVGLNPQTLYSRIKKLGISRTLDGLKC